MQKIIFSLPGNALLANSLASKLKSEQGKYEYRNFPDGETYIKINSDVKDKELIFVCTLNHPDLKLLPLYFLAKTAKDLGAKKITLVAPYLAYMRQDKRFNPGEGITSTYFASLLSSFVDELITIDPHLHRRSLLSEIYTIPSKVMHASELISDWIKVNVPQPVLVGPDSESEQWVKEVAQAAGAPYFILQKTRSGDKDVKEIVTTNIEKYSSYIPVLVDDIISTAHTMMETIRILKRAKMNPPICIGVHGIFADGAYEELVSAGAGNIITSNSIPHKSNAIEIDGLIVKALRA